MSRLLNFALNRVFRMSARDNKSGFILTDRNKMRLILEHRETYIHFQTFVGVSAKAKGFAAIEVVTPFEDRKAGTSFLAGRSVRVALQVLRDIRLARREFKPPKTTTVRNKNDTDTNP